MDKIEICKEIIKIANKLDEFGKHEMANELTKTAQMIGGRPRSRNLLDSFGRNLAGSLAGALMNPASWTKSPKITEDLSNAQNRINKIIENSSKVRDTAIQSDILSKCETLNTSLFNIQKAKSDFDIKKKRIYSELDKIPTKINADIQYNYNLDDYDDTTTPLTPKSNKQLVKEKLAEIENLYAEEKKLNVKARQLNAQINQMENYVSQNSGIMPLLRQGPRYY